MQMPTRNAGTLNSLQNLEQYIAAQRAKREAFWSRRNGPLTTAAAPKVSASGTLPSLTRKRPAARAFSTRPYDIAEARSQESMDEVIAAAQRALASARAANTQRSARARCRYAPATAALGSPTIPSSSGRIASATTSRPHGAAPRSETKASFAPWSGRSRSDAASARSRTDSNRSSARHTTATNTSALELRAIRAITARADSLDRLDLVCAKVQQAHECGTGFVAHNSPLQKLFYAAVAKARLKTLDAVEGVAAWERAAGAARPFVYRCVFPQTTSVRVR